MYILLVQQWRATTLEGEAKLLEGMVVVKNMHILKKSCGAIVLSLIDEILREVVDQTGIVGLWDKLGGNYQKQFSDKQVVS